ncbi:aminoglycoside phosphotransferase family protein [Lacibacterium aquatile]|uniref:Aminoglycoside phosphotransferase family protein n=1 Tax=Lacibacterium aquatile TaxID=1168082 RepID=A0ABW5DTB9_9PROT
MLDHYLEKWHLTPDGPVVTTSSSQLFPVLSQGRPAMLKLTEDAEERHGGAVMAWWDGGGATPVLAFEEGAVLMARGADTLVSLVAQGKDEEATRIICQTAVALHQLRPTDPPACVVPLASWFSPLEAVARTHGGLFAKSQAAAERLLPNQQEITVLHGDLHHENILDFGPSGWLAIDPKRVIGDRAFEYAILFCDPDLGPSGVKVAGRPEIFARRVEVVCEAANLERGRLLCWILAWTGLSAAWTLEDGGEITIESVIGAMAAAALDV